MSERTPMQQFVSMRAKARRAGTLHSIIFRATFDDGSPDVVLYESASADKSGAAPAARAVKRAREIKGRSALGCVLPIGIVERDKRGREITTYTSDENSAFVDNRRTGMGF